MKEVWDLYDRERNLLDKKVERGTKLNDDEYHLVANAWIRNKEGKFLTFKEIESIIKKGKFLKSHAYIFGNFINR